MESSIDEKIEVEVGDQSMTKILKVVFIDDKLEKQFYALKDDDPIKKSIIKSIRKLQKDAFSGIQIPKRLIPKEYIQKYEIDNLWKCDLSGGWRLLYTIAGDEVEIISAILDYFNHKDYEKRMKY